MSSPFLSYKAPQARAFDVEIAALGLCLGALAGTAVPLLAVALELLGGATTAELARSGSFLATLTVPVLTAAIGALGWQALYQARAAYHHAAAKAGTLLEENWDLAGQIGVTAPLPRDVPPIAVAGPPQAQHHQTEADAPPLPRVGWTLELAPAQQQQRDSEALIQAQSQILASFGLAAQDAARRMHVNLKGLRFTHLDDVQLRMVDAITGHMEGLWDLAEDVVTYTDEDPAPQTHQDPRSARPRRPPGRVAA